MSFHAPPRRIMFDFAERTGLTSSVNPPVRYLWTAAFDVCNFLGSFVEYADEEALALALRLEDQTHSRRSPRRRVADRSFELAFRDGR